MAVAVLPFISVFVIVHSTYRPCGGGDDTVRAPTMDHHLCGCGRNFAAGNNHSYSVEGESADNRALSVFLSVKFLQIKPAVASGRGDSFDSSASALTTHGEPLV